MSPPLTRMSWHFASLSAGTILRFYFCYSALMVKSGLLFFEQYFNMMRALGMGGTLENVLQTWRVSALNRIIVHGSSVIPPPPPANYPLLVTDDITCYEMHVAWCPHRHQPLHLLPDTLFLDVAYADKRNEYDILESSSVVQGMVL
jgi:hypothetical protein